MKHKQTKEQAFFNCNICECELKSVVTLRAHCKGTQHMRKALQKKKVLQTFVNSLHAITLHSGVPRC